VINVELERILSGELFDRSEDLTIGIEEEFQILDPVTLELIGGFHTLVGAASSELKESLKGELILSEIEISTKKCLNFKEAREDLTEKRRQLTATARKTGFMLCATGAHPFSPWYRQEIIDTPHYRLVDEKLRYVAWRNNTFSFHVHLGVHGAERAVALADLLRNYLPALLALSASSPFYENYYTHLHSVRTQLFTKNFPRCGIPDAFGSWAAYREYIKVLFQVNSITEFTQVWWSVRPHLNLGTVEVRICDAQPNLEDTLALSALIQALAARLLNAIDRGEGLTPLPNRYLEENCWRAIRYGLAGKQIDFDQGAEHSVADTIKKLLDWVSREAALLGTEAELARIEKILQEGNSALRQIALYQEGHSLFDIQKASATTTMCGDPVIC